jgi:hypothetical protein
MREEGAQAFVNPSCDHRPLGGTAGRDVRLNMTSRATHDQPGNKRSCTSRGKASARKCLDAEVDLGAVAHSAIWAGGNSGLICLPGLEGGLEAELVVDGCFPRAGGLALWRGRDDAGLDQLQAIEETSDLLRAAQRDRGLAELVPLPDGLV